MLVPLKAAGIRKQRLAGILDAPARDALAEAMLARVGATLAEVAGVTPILLAAVRPAGWAGAWLRETAAGLNPALAAARAALGAARLAVLHADLPYLTAGDVTALLAAAERAGCAIAPDAAGSGTNAIAIADGRPLPFRFGPDSFAAHLAAAGPAVAVVRRDGLARDIDTAADWRALAASDRRGDTNGRAM